MCRRHQTALQRLFDQKPVCLQTWETPQTLHFRPLCVPYSCIGRSLQRRDQGPGSIPVGNPRFDMGPICVLRCKLGLMCTVPHGAPYHGAFSHCLFPHFFHNGGTISPKELLHPGRSWTHVE